jgi:NAD(P)-dependent dehydrogenase (short-subunit alcohol dehydrogenase family)
MNLMFENKTALVTGANQGIGYAIVTELALLGFTVYLGCRDMEKGTSAANKLNGNVIPLHIDVTDMDSIQRAVEIVRNQQGKLDVLINNAGTNVSRNKPSKITSDELRKVYETNVFGVLNVTNAFLPLLQEAQKARVINISSLRGSLGDEGAFAGEPSASYSTSKTALNAITVHYAREFAGTHITFNMAAPGSVATAFNGFTGKRTPAEGAAIAIKFATNFADDSPNGEFRDDNGIIPW